jgi:hypothetical protein
MGLPSALNGGRRVNMLIEEVSDHIIARRQQNPGMEPVKLDGMNLLYEADWLSKGLRYDYLWFKYLREVVGIYLTPDEQGEASFFCPPELRSPVWDKYEKAFIDWRDNVYFDRANGYVDGKWFDTAKGMLVIAPMIRDNVYVIGMSTLERNHGAGREICGILGATVLQVLNWLSKQLDMLDEYVKKGWIPMVQLPVVFTSQGPRPAYRPKEPEVYAFIDPFDVNLGK